MTAARLGALLCLTPLVCGQELLLDFSRFLHVARGDRILSIDDFGAVSDSAFNNQETKNVTQLSLTNTAAFNKALRAAESGMTVLVPDNKSYTFTGGILGQYLNGVTIDIAGSCHFVHDLNVWPFHNSTVLYYLPAIKIVDSKNIRVTSSSKNRAEVVVDYRKNQIYLKKGSSAGGVVNGNGKVWWDDAIFGRLPNKDGDTRPRLIHIQSSADILVEHLTLLNSPYWTLTVEAIRSEIRHVSVLVDRKYQSKALAKSMSSRTLAASNAAMMTKFPLPDGIPDWVGRRLHQPEDLNTDGIDVIGTDFWVHDCIIQNADDSVAVKPPSQGNETTALNGTMPYNCTRNVTIENVVLSGFGASIGSVGAKRNHPCVDQVIYRNVSMPGTGKGIYVKSDGCDCNDGESSQITNILYEDVRMSSPFWWPIWIGPQQQHQPHAGLDGKCPLLYPIPGSRNCPTQGCTTFENITIRNVQIENPLLSPGVILGNETNPIRNLLFENISVSHSNWKPFDGRWPFHDKHYPFEGAFKCTNAQVRCANCNPQVQC